MLDRDAKNAPAEAGAERLGYRPGLDGLRGIAVLLVVSYHATVTFGWVQFPAGGALGVDLFFVLSGFLITGVLLGDGREGWVRRFYVRRVRRLLPAMVVMLVAVWFIARAAGDWADTGNSIGAVLTYVGNLKMAAGDGFSRFLAHTWSLSIEEQFYLVWPFVLAGVVRFDRRRVIVGLLATAAVVGVWRLHLYDVAPAAAYKRTDARIDGLLIGAALGLVGVGALRRVARFAPVAAVVFAVAVVWMPPSSRFAFGPGFTLVALSAAVLVAWAAVGDVWVSWEPLRRVGLVSYGLYLWHFPILRWLEDWRAIPVTVVVTVASYLLVERPLRTKHVQRRVGTGAAHAGGVVGGDAQG